MRPTLGLIPVFTVSAICQTMVPEALAAYQDPPVPTRIILFMADGAGAGHWSALQLAVERPAVTDFAAFGLVDTRGADHVVTGSAASGTAFAIGKRTYRGAQGVGPDSMPSQTVLEAAEQRGMSTGVISTTVISDATVAAFTAHTQRRTALGAARQMHRSGVDVVMGGGRRLFTLIAEDNGPPVLQDFLGSHAYVTSDMELDTLDLAKTDRLLGLFADDDLPMAPMRSPSLDRMTAVALEILDRDPEGFFLLVENEETDTQAHNHGPLDRIVSEMAAFDRAIRVGLEYQTRHPETLVIVTADHETAGMSITMDANGDLQASYHTTYHTAEPVPLFASGPGAEHFAGWIENARVGQLLLTAVRHGLP